MIAKRVSLWFMPNQVMLLLEHPSGVVYQNQVGGNVCSQEEIEGVLAPIDFSDADTETIMSLHYRNGALGLDEETARTLEAVLASQPRARHIKLDRARMNESCEAWIHVVVTTPTDPTQDVPPKDDYFGSAFGFGRTRGVLTWPNSD